MNKIIKISILSFILAVSSTLIKAESEVFYSVLGKVTSINKNKIVVGDNAIRISPTLKIVRLNSDLPPSVEVKVGDFVGISTVFINNRELVDTITLFPPQN